jgi:hypothetical protein
MRNHGNNFKHIQLPQEKHINVQQSINQNFISSNSGGVCSFSRKKTAMKRHGDS